MNGILLVNKPANFTSHDIVDFIRKEFKIKKVGHAGTLDPSATGLLIILIGDSTKLFSKFANMKKQYLITLKLGESTDTMDQEGKIIKKKKNFNISAAKIKKELKNFKGDIMQIPPMYSALKVKGKKLYELARKGKKISRKPRKIHIYSIKLVDFSFPLASIKVIFSKGTYTRKICYDLGKKVNIPSHQHFLIREKIGEFSICQALDLQEIKNMNKKQLEKTIAKHNKL